MRKLPKHVALMALSMAAAAALPISPLQAQDRERDRNQDRERDRGDDRKSDLTEKILQADDLPDAVRRTIEREAVGTNHFVNLRDRDDQIRYVVHFTAPDGKRMRLRTDERGELIEEPNLALVQPEANLEEEHARDEADRSVRYTSVTEDEVPERVLKAMKEFREGTVDPFFRRQVRDGKTFYSVHYTTPASERMWVRVAEDGKVAEGPHINIGRDIGLNVAGGDRARDRDRDRDRANRPRESGDTARRDRRDRPDRPRPQEQSVQMRREELTGGQLPDEVRKSVEQNTAKGGGHRFFRETNGDEVTYLVEWDVDGEPHNLRLDEQGKVVAGIPLGTEMRREELTGDKLPDEVRKSVEKNAAQGGGHRFFRETKGDEVTYLVEWDVDGKPHNLRLDESGKVVEGIALAARPQPQPQPQPAGEQPAPPMDDDAELGAGEESIGVQNQVIGATDMSPEVRQTFDKLTQGATDPIFQRHDLKGRALYTAHYTNAEGVRNFVTLDDRGQVVVEPRESRTQRGGPGVRFEAVSVDALPAEVRKALEKAAPRGTEHLFVVRTAEGGGRSYLVQFTNARGRRMEMTIRANGEVASEPDGAREQPFRLVGRQRDGRNDGEPRRPVRQ